MKIIKMLSAIMVVVSCIMMHSVKSAQFPFPFADLPRDMQSEIMVVHLNNEIDSLPPVPESLPIAAEKVRALTIMNKDLNEIINRPQFTYKLIKGFAQRFQCTDEQVARALGTRGSQQRIDLQDELLDEVGGYEQFSPQLFESLCRRGADLEWVDQYNQTPLMFAVWNVKIKGILALLSKGVNVNQIPNGPNSAFPNSALNFVLSKNIPVWPDYGKHPTGQILEVIKILLAAGADPEATYTLNNVEKYSDRPAVIKAIKDAQAAQKRMRGNQ